MTDETDPTQEVLRTWDTVAPGWERYRTRLFESARAVSDWLVDALAPVPGQTVLELNAGPGETGFVVAERVGPTGRLLSTDLAPGMVEAIRALCLGSNTSTLLQGGTTLTHVTQALAWIGGILLVFVPLSVLRYRRTT